MSSLYPGGLDSFPTDRTNDTVMEDNHPGDHNNLADAVNQIEATLGIDPAASFDTVAERLDAISPAILIEPKNVPSAQLLNLHNTPVELLPAPGGRLYYVVHHFVMHYRFVTTPYTYTSSEIATGMMAMYGNTLPGYEGAYFAPLHLDSGTPRPSNLFKGTGDLYVYEAISSANLVSYAWAAEDIEGLALNLLIDPAVMPTGLTLGDGTLTMRLFYSLIDGAA